MKLLIIALVAATACAVPQFSHLQYTLDENSSTDEKSSADENSSTDEKSSSEEGVGPGARTTNCSCGWTNTVRRRERARGELQSALVPDAASFTGSPAAETRIVGGHETDINDYPMLAGLVDSDTGEVFCSATIITPFHVLTAAHCTSIMDYRKLQVVVGEHDVTTKEEVQRVPVAYTIEHEKYNALSSDNDMAILVLERDLTFNQNVGPVCLPTQKANLDGEWVKALGWRRLTNKGDTSSVLTEVNLKVLPISSCTKSYMREIVTENPTQICTYRTKNDSCQGDSGGPLIWLDPETNRYTQVGLVTYDKDCASMAPAVNTDVAYYVPWIQAKIAATKLGGQICAKV